MPDSLPPNWRPPLPPPSKPVNPHTADLRVWFHDFVEREGRASITRCHLAEAQRLERAARPECGNCYHWMKRSSCPAEARGDKRSMQGIACGTYQESYLPGHLRELATVSRNKAIEALQGVGQK